MPVSMCNPGEKYIIARVGGADKIKRHLNNLGFIEGEPIMVINKIDDNVIVKLKGVSLAITNELAKKIFV